MEIKELILRFSYQQKTVQMPLPLPSTSCVARKIKSIAFVYSQSFVSRGFTVPLSYTLSRGLSAAVIFALYENVTVRVNKFSYF